MWKDTEILRYRPIAILEEFIYTMNSLSQDRLSEAMIQTVYLPIVN
jgi:hypothetical protein